MAERTITDRRERGGSPATKVVEIIKTYLKCCYNNKMLVRVRA